MPKGRTGFEILRSWVTGTREVPVEKQYHNPLQARIGGHVRFQNVPDFADDLWTITALWAWTRKIGGNKHPMADYLLDSDERRLVLRVMPRQSRGRDSTGVLLALTQHFPDAPGPLPWGEESPHILAALTDQTGELVRFAGTPEEVRYFRDLNGVHADVAVVSDVNGDGTVEIDEVQTVPYTFWTFRRDTTDEAEQDVTQHLHMHLSGLYNQQTGKVQGGDKDLLMLRGGTVPSANVLVYG